jgi:hypothetical protein
MGKQLFLPCSGQTHFSGGPFDKVLFWGHFAVQGYEGMPSGIANRFYLKSIFF